MPRDLDASWRVPPSQGGFPAPAVKPGKVSITPGEQKVLDSLAHAWNAYRQLDSNGAGDSDYQDLLNSIHAAQRVIATRVARRANPEVWR